MSYVYISLFHPSFPFILFKYINRYTNANIGAW